MGAAASTLLKPSCRATGRTTRSPCFPTSRPHLGVFEVSSPTKLGLLCREPSSLSSVWEKNVTTSFVGEWWRLLAPGRYCVRALDPHLGTPSAWKSVTVEAIDSRVHQRVDLVLGEEGGLPPECQRSTQSPFQSEEGGGGRESSSVGRPVLALALFFASTVLLFR